MTLEDRIARLGRMTVAQLRDQYRGLFGEATTSGNKSWLVKRVAWRLQANAEGTLSDRARQRAMALANDADLRVTVPRAKADPSSAGRTKTVPVAFDGHDHRLPMPGAVLAREYKGRTVHVRVLADGFEWDGVVYPSLSAAAKAITGSHLNGFLFFRLNRKGAMA